MVIQGAFNIGEPRQMKLKDLTGQKFNYLTVLKRVENTKKGHLCLKEWAEKLKMNYQTLRGRLKKGWSFEDAITIPIRKFSKKDIQEVE